LGPMMPCFVEFLAPAMLYGTFIFMCIYRIHQLIAYKSKVTQANQLPIRILGILSPLCS
jgi:hypothetical protein